MGLGIQGQPLTNSWSRRLPGCCDALTLSVTTCGVSLLVFSAPDILRRFSRTERRTYTSGFVAPSDLRRPTPRSALSVIVPLRTRSCQYPALALGFN
ncbi:hypothetical protein COMA2_160127 [Candidatus Nitrospira nitrificans]|uniref:Uncharacterized protein n=1 Tax=Candidatus Nitrospira nitrificans TaxID=1742973 RepID=A0A0S4L9M0_9BACT|nr:hypothetical protein COMA2_160127 [Candidatus Nitrospira nitrificans]